MHLSKRMKEKDINDKINKYINERSRNVYINTRDVIQMMDT